MNYEDVEKIARPSTENAELETPSRLEEQGCVNERDFLRVGDAELAGSERQYL